MCWTPLKFNSVIKVLLFSCTFVFRFVLLSCERLFSSCFSDIGADVLDLSGSKLEFGDDLKLEPVSDNKFSYHY